MNADQTTTADLATRWLLAHPAGNDYLGSKLGEIVGNMPDGKAPEWLEVHNTGGTGVVEVTMGFGASRLEFSCPASPNPTAWAHIVTSEAEVLSLPGEAVDGAADLTNWTPIELAGLVKQVTSTLETSVKHARDIGQKSTSQVRDDLTPEPMKRMPNAGELEALTDLIEEHAKLQASMDINATYVRLCQERERPDLVSPEMLTQNLSNPVVQIDAGVADLLGEHWDRVYLDSLARQLQIIPAAETNNEINADLAAERAAEQDRGQRLPDFPTSLYDEASREQNGPSLPPAEPGRGPALPPSAPERDGGRE